MVDWIFDRNGYATLILDGDCLRNNKGIVIAWIYSNNLYSLNGEHKGWFENGVLYDSNNDAIGFVRNFTGYLPSVPGIGVTSGMPGFAGKPGHPGLCGVPGRPGYGGWSYINLSEYFN